MSRKPVKENDRRRTVAISLTDGEKQRLTEYAGSCGLSLSAFLRMAAFRMLKEGGNRRQMSALIGFTANDRGSNVQ